jgi:HD-like signal output (HDOD) protein
VAWWKKKSAVVQERGGRPRAQPAAASDELDALTRFEVTDDEEPPWEQPGDGSMEDAREILIEALRAGTFQLPLMPSTVRQAMVLTRDPKSSFVGLSGIIETDPTLTGQLLKLANSPLFGGMQQVGSLKHALIRIGLDGVRELLLIASTSRMLVVPGNRRLTDRLQQRAVAVALTANCIAHRRGQDGDSAFTAGILHDVGQAVAWQLIRDCRARLPSTLNDDVHAQKALADSVHESVGGRLGIRWNLPEETIAAMEQHHDPDPDEPEHALARIVAAARWIVDDLGVYPEDGSGLLAHHRPVVQQLGLFGPELRAVKETVARRLGLPPT